MATKFSNVKVSRENFNMEAFHKEMQRLRKLPPSSGGKDMTLKQMLSETYGADYTPEKFYAELGIDLKGMTVDKLINTSDLTRWLFPEIFRDAIRTGLEYAPFYSRLIAGEERVEGTGITMPKLTTPPADDVRLRDTAEAATITEGVLVIWEEKQVTIKKKARGLKQSYESIMFTPINLARIYFEELGARLGSDLDKELITILLNGDQGDNSEAAPVIGAAVANTLAYTDLARAWIRFQRIGRRSSVMLMSEADAITILNMPQFENKNPAGGTNAAGVTLNVNTPLPSSQDILVHSSMPTGKILFVDVARAVIQLTAMPLLIESERIVARQLNGEYVSIITGFANIFKNGRMVLDYTTNLTTNPGPTANDAA